MSTRLLELKRQREHALNKADAVIKAAESGTRELTQNENLEYHSSMKAVDALNREIAAIERNNTITRMIDTQTGSLLLDGGRPFSKPVAPALSDEYAVEFWDYIKSNGERIGAALYEGSGSAGGYVVPLVVDQQIVPLAPSEMAIRRLATVMPTVMDIKMPIKAAHGTAAAKPESGSSPSSFGGTAPTLAQKTLSAYMAGVIDDVSFELAQDVPSFQAFVVDDLIIAQQQYEENKYLNGSGSGEPEGLVSTVDNGVAAASPDSNGNLVSINATLDVMGTLNAIYHPNASWLMQRATSIGIRKAQVESNLFAPVWTRENGQDFLHGYPVEYSQYMPAAAAGNTPVVFGDFKRAYVIGDRGGSGINIKVLDQPKASQGLISLLAYRRSDGRVRRSEACKSLTLHT